MLFKPQITRKYDYNPDPRLSAGQLAEYLNAVGGGEEARVSGGEHHPAA